MSRFVIDASVAIKWVVQEKGTEQALALRQHQLTAPDLIAPECANILWKKVRLAELGAGQALLSARLLERADLEVMPTRPLLAAASELAITFDHAAYDCVYLALALYLGVQFVTADAKFIRRVRERGTERQHGAIVNLLDV